MTSAVILAQAGALDQILLCGMVLVALSLWVGQWLPVEVTSILLIAALAMSGILEPAEAFSGLSHPATVTVGAMFVISSGLLRTGSLEFLALRLAEFSGGSLSRLLLLLLVLVAPASAFLNNTPIVVMMLPVVVSLCRRFDIRPSKLLIPLSFFSILGGTCTLLGTSTNIIVSDLYREYAQEHPTLGGFELREGFELFDFAPLGLAYLLVGAVFLFLVARRLLPERASLSGILEPGRRADFVTEVIIRGDSPFVGRLVGEVFEGSKVRLLELLRGEEILLPSQARESRLEPENSLIVEGTPQDIDDFLHSSGTTLATVVEDDIRVPMRTFELVLAEAVILPYSSFEGLTVSELGLNRRFGVKVMAVQRQGRHHRYRIRGMRLHAGDVLLIQADTQGLNALRETEGILVVEGIDRTLVRPRKAPIAIAVLVGVVGLAVSGLFDLPLAVIALLGALGMLLGRCIRLDEALRSLDAGVLLLLSATIPLGVALETTGLARLAVDTVVDVVGIGPDGVHRPWLFVSAFYLLTTVLTALVSNNAVAILLTPVALGLSESTGIHPEALLITICFGASASFLTPIGYQTNAIVMGPGGYTFRDFLAIGLPLNILLWITASFLIPVFWPLG